MTKKQFRELYEKAEALKGKNISERLEILNSLSVVFNENFSEEFSLTKVLEECLEVSEVIVKRSYPRNNQPTHEQLVSELSDLMFRISILILKMEKDYEGSLQDTIYNLIELKTFKLLAKIYNEEIDNITWDE